jgi:hypothetical protein
MKPSIALATHRVFIRRIVALHHTHNARVFGSVVHGDDTESLAGEVSRYRACRGSADMSYDPLCLVEMTCPCYTTKCSGYFWVCRDG